MSRMADNWFESVGSAAERWIQRTPWTNVYGVARTILALATVGTLLATPNAALFARGTGMTTAPVCDGPSRLGVFCVLGQAHLGVSKAVAIAVLLLVASGWRPRWTCIPHWWISLSVFVDLTVSDGGDQITSILTLLLIPIALTDSRRWHWTAPQRTDAADRPFSALTAKAFLALIGLQMAGLYLQAAISKLGVPQWRDGTALYYWLHDPTFGMPGWLAPLVDPLLSSAALVSAMTWGSLVVEFALGIALLLNRRFYPYIAVFGMILHVTIFLLMGLASFSAAMAAGLILYLRRSDHYFSWQPVNRLKEWLVGVRQTDEAAVVVPQPAVPQARVDSRPMTKSSVVVSGGRSEASELS